MALISMIAAMDKNCCIGKKGKLPWHISADLKHFKNRTLGKPIIMGRLTWHSLKELPLPDRKNIVLTRAIGSYGNNVTIVNTIDDALKEAGNVKEVMIIGGGQIYNLAMSRADRLYLTCVDTEVKDGDAFFPEFSDKDWTLTEEDGPYTDEKSGLTYTYKTYDRA